MLGYARSALTQPAKLVFSSQTSGFLCISRVIGCALAHRFYGGCKIWKKCFSRDSATTRYATEPHPGPPPQGEGAVSLFFGLAFSSRTALTRLLSVLVRQGAPYRTLSQFQRCRVGLAPPLHRFLRSNGRGAQGAPYGSYLLGTLVALIPSPPTVPRPARRRVGVRGGRGGAAYSRGTPRRRAILARGG